MKILKKYESFLIGDIKVDVLTRKEFDKLFFKIYPDQNINLKEKIRFFDYSDFSSGYGYDKKHEKTLRFIVAYNNKDILGICKFAFWNFSQTYAVSYLSTNIDYRKQGISKMILEELFKYFSQTYPNEKMYWSGYSVEGWNYLRNNILTFSKKYNVKISEKAVEYDIDSGDELFTKSRQIVNKEYGHQYWYPGQPFNSYYP